MKEELARSLEEHDSPEKNQSMEMVRRIWRREGSAPVRVHSRPVMANQHSNQFWTVRKRPPSYTFIQDPSKVGSKWADSGLPYWKALGFPGVGVEPMARRQNGGLSRLCAPEPDSRLTRGSSIPCAQPSVPPNRKEMKC